MHNTTIPFLVLHSSDPYYNESTWSIINLITITRKERKIRYMLPFALPSARFATIYLHFFGSFGSFGRSYDFTSTSHKKANFISYASPKYLPSMAVKQKSHMRPRSYQVVGSAKFIMWWAEHEFSIHSYLVRIRQLPRTSSFILHPS